MSQHPETGSNRPDAAWSASRLVLGSTVIDQLPSQALLAETLRVLETLRAPELVVSGNARGIMLAERDPAMRRAYDIAKLIRVDGASLGLASRLQGVPAVRRSTWADFIWELTAFLEGADRSLYLLGGGRHAVDTTVKLIRARHPALRLVGHRDGYFDQWSGSAESAAVVADLAATRPDIVVVGLGMPRQERWLLENLDRLPPAVYMTAGGVFDYASGAVRRAPPWMCDHGLEWLGRMAIEPRRLVGRYAADLPRFGWLMLISTVRRRRHLPARAKRS